MAELGEANIGGRMVPAWLLNPTAEELDSLKWHSNPNLLDNWYFGNPVNQRGQASYTGAVYTIDRWIFDGDNASMLIEGSGLHFVSSASATGNEAIHQKFENPGRYSGKAVTYSMLGSTNHSFGMLLLVNGSIFGPISSGVVAGETLLSYTAVLPDNITSLEAYYYPKNASGTGEAYLRGCKLELGTQQTLAHQDENGVWQLNEIPDYGEQLARCQRYFIRIGVPAASENGAIGFANCANTTLANAVVNTPVTMRAVPTATLKNIVLRKGITDFSVTGCNVFAITGNGIYMNFVSSGLTAGDQMLVRTVTGGYIDFSADL